MAVQTTKPTALRDGPAPDATNLRLLRPGAILAPTGETKDTWIKVNFSPSPGISIAGWVNQADCQQVADPGRPEVNVEGFIRQCIVAEGLFNALPTTAPWYVLADFIIARAVIETNITNAPPKTPGSDGVGPLQVTSAEWDQLLKDGGSFAEGLAAGDRDNATLQISGAVYRMYSDAKAISGLKPAADAGQTKDPFVPSYLDIFHAYLTNSPAAAFALLTAAANDQSKGSKAADVLAASMSAQQIDAMLTKVGQLAQSASPPVSVSDLVSATETILNGALKKAFELIQQNAPEAIAKAGQGEAPWFDVAKAELDKNIAEPNPHILDYFQSTDFTPKPTSTTTPWCGAFASFCMAQSGNPTIAASIPKGSAAAASWKTWGSEISLQSGEIPQGAVVVLSHTPNTSGTGHVGFFVELTPDGKQVRLLGGNQSNKVVITPFDKGRVGAVRWIDLAPTTAASESGGTPSDTPISQKSIDLIVEFEVSSKANYEKRLHKPEWPQGASGVTIGIGYDVGYSTPAKLTQDWTGLIPNPMIAALSPTCGKTGAVAGPLAKQLAGVVDVPWDAAMTVFTKTDVPQWVGRVQRALANTDLLRPDSLGALVSLAYNRGASFAKAGDRYVEMNNIRKHMADKNFAAIPNEFRSMKRLWPNMAGLRDRRDREADLFQAGLNG